MRCCLRKRLCANTMQQVQGNKDHENGEMRRKEEENRWLQKEFVCSVMEKN